MLITYANRLHLVILEHAILTSGALQRQASVGLCSRETRHAKEHNSVLVAVNTDIAEVLLTIAKVATVIQEHVYHRATEGRVQLSNTSRNYTLSRSRLCHTAGSDPGLTAACTL